MATVVRQELARCEGFRVESARGLLGWVEETWLGSADEPVALAVRTIDGRDGLLVAEDVETVVPESQLIVMLPEARLLELDLPRIEASANRLSASWRTTGEVLEPPDPPGLVGRAVLAFRPWRLAPPPGPEAERPVLVVLTGVYTALTVIVLLMTGLCFLAAWLAAGNAV